MSITEAPDDRATSIEMASALTLSVSSLHDHNDALVAENDSLRTAFTAVASEANTCGGSGRSWCASATRPCARRSWPSPS